jgi:metal-responsive CopG/Arc/MetJ family transcriptional regulator
MHSGKNLMRLPQTLSSREKRTERLQIILPSDEIAAIDDFRYQARMTSRAAAVRELLRRGLVSAEEEQKTLQKS